MAVFADRVDAGRQLAQKLDALRGQDVVVLGLPRGGVPVAFEVARSLDAPLDVIVVRKLGVPFQPELAMGAIGEDGVRVLDPELVALARISPAEVAAVERRERAVLDARVAQLRRGRQRLELTGRVAVIVDDGIATGATARAACQVARRLGASRVILAAPVAPADTVRNLPEADAVVCVSAPDQFFAVGAHYRNFAPTSDGEVSALIDSADQRVRREALAQQGTDCVDTEVQIPIGAAVLEGHLKLPDQPRGIVVFAHGSGSSRHSPRNRFVAEVLQQAGLGTLLLDLLTGKEERDRANVFDIDLLAARLTAATNWLTGRADAAGAAIGYFGASTGAAAALWAAAEPESQVQAVVSRGGRPDLAGQRLDSVRAPTLLIVGSADTAVLDLNRRAQARLRCPSRLEVVAGASHLFEEPGTLGQAALLARDWFCAHLLRPPVPPAVEAPR
jgi:putative phosphoribosyl transferase